MAMLFVQVAEASVQAVDIKSILSRNNNFYQLNPTG
jgi:hypothetical protein